MSVRMSASVRYRSRSIRRHVVLMALLIGPVGCATHSATPAATGAVTESARTAPTIVYLVRHAEKASATDPDPSLSATGVIRAAALRETLRSTGIQTVLTSDRKRTRETAEPLATERMIVSETISLGAGSAGAYAAAVASRVRADFTGRRVLIVGHSNTVTETIAALGGPQLPDLCDAQYSVLFRLVLDSAGTAPQLTRTTYGAPDPPRAAECAQR